MLVDLAGWFVSEGMWGCCWKRNQLLFWTSAAYPWKCGLKLHTIITFNTIIIVIIVLLLLAILVCTAWTAMIFEFDTKWILNPHHELITDDWHSSLSFYKRFHSNTQLRIKLTAGMHIPVHYSPLDCNW